MLPYRLSFPRRLSSNRRLRPPNASKQKSKVRLFTQNSQLLLLSPASPRPQLPFLYPPSGPRHSQTIFQNQFRFQISRLLTTERKHYIKTEIKRAAKYTVYGWTLFGLLSLAWYGIQSEYLERIYPSPPDWTLFSRIEYRNARNEENPSANEYGHVDHVHVGAWYFKLLARLEHPSLDGADLEPLLKDEGDIYITGVGKSGLNISSKSEPWRRGYHECLMGAARAAEHLDGWVKDKTRDISFPSNMVIGPSNPRPKPVPAGGATPPLEENCVPAFESPEFYYTKILTTHGFNTRQRLDAALAYADWLDFKGLPTSAKEMFDWALDIAINALPAEVSDIIDRKSGVLSNNAKYVSSNLFLAATSLAIHHARNKDFAAALPIFLSILRAKKQLPHPPSDAPPALQTLGPSPQPTGLLAAIQSLLVTPPYPAAPPTGDQPQVRTPMAACEEAGITVHIGEILFASSSPFSTFSPPANSKLAFRQSQQSGINWTRDAVDTAEAIILATPREDRDARQKCAECVNVGLDNWGKMTARMVKDAQRRQQQHKPEKSHHHPSRSGNSWILPGGTFGSTNQNDTDADADTKDEESERWIREAQAVEERKIRLGRMLREEGLASDKVAVSGPQEWGLLFR